MWSNVVVVDLVARNDRRLGLLEAAHDLFSVSDFSVEPFHFVVVSVDAIAQPCQLLERGASNESAPVLEAASSPESDT